MSLEKPPGIIENVRIRGGPSMLRSVAIVSLSESMPNCRKRPVALIFAGWPLGARSVAGSTFFVDCALSLALGHNDSDTLI